MPYVSDNPGTSTNNSLSNGATGLGSVAIGSAASGTRVNSIAIGQTADSRGLNSIAIGGNSQARDEGGVGIGADSYARFRGSVALGQGAVSNSNFAIAIGSGVTADGNNSTAIGYTSTTAGNNATAIGNGNTASERQTTAVGYQNTASGYRGVAVGHTNTNAGVNSAAVGYGNNIGPAAAGGTVPDSASALGVQNNAYANNSTAVGSGNTASQIASTAMGYQSTAVGVNSTAIGRRANASGPSSVSLGNRSDATGENSIAIGLDNSASASNSIAMGYGSAAAGQFGVAIGRGANTSNQWNSIAIGQSATAQGTRSVILGLQAGLNSLTTNDNQIAMGAQSGQSVNGINNTALGYQAGSTVADQNNTAIGTRSGTNMTGSRNAAFGWNAGQSVNGGDNLLLGSFAGTNNAGNFNSALGYASGYGSQGNYNINSGHSSGAFVTGSNNVAIGNRAGTAGLIYENLTNAQPVVSDSTALDVDGTVSLGNGAYSTKDYGIAIGSTATTTGEGAVAVGAGSSVTAERSTAIGARASASTADSVALGNRATTATAVGTTSASILGTTYDFAGKVPLGTVSIGTAGEERTLTNLAAGRVSGTSTDAVNGSQLFATNQALTSLAGQTGAGWGISAGGLNQTMVGADSATGNEVNLANTDANITVQKSATSNDVTFNLADNIRIATSLTVGRDFIVDASGATYSGPITSGDHITNKTYVDQAIAGIGPGGTPTTINFGGNYGTNVARTHNDTLFVRGNQTTAGTYDGANVQTVANAATGDIMIQIATAPKFGSVVVNDGETGRITGVTAAVLSNASTQAVNGSQLVALGSSMAATLSPGSTYDPATNTINAQISIGNTVYNSVQDAIQAAANGNGGGTTPQAPSSWSIGTNATGSGVAHTSVNAEVRDQGVLTLTAGDNIVTRQAGSAVTIELNRNLTNLESVSIAGGPTINSSGIDMAGGRITNMADGIADADAVTMRQFNNGLNETLNRANTYTDNAINRFGGQLNDYRRDASAGTAAAMAMSQLPQSQSPGSNMVSMGVSTWDNEQAIALGYSRATSDGRFVVRASGAMNTRSQAGASVGVGFQF